MSKPVGFGFLEFKTFTTQMLLKNTQTKQQQQKKLKQSQGILERSAMQNEIYVVFHRASRVNLMAAPILHMRKLRLSSEL